MLDQTLTHLTDWAQQGYLTTVAVILSARHLMDEACPRQIRRMLEKHRVDPVQLEPEIAESAIIVDPERATNTLRHLHEMGVKVSMDDFGVFFRMAALIAVAIAVRSLRELGGEQGQGYFMVARWTRWRRRPGW